jgi:hypothetical protein
MSTGFGNLPPGWTGAGCESAALSELATTVAAANNAKGTDKGRGVFFIGGWF